MLENIKSSYIYKIIFSYIDDKRKLNLFKYNKKSQTKIDINIYHYKYFSKKYIVYENNGKGKEYYDFGALIFEGEYLNGQRNGKGKEYYLDDTLQYEGEYLNGLRNGKGKEYYEFSGKLKYEGEYLNGLWNGEEKNIISIVVNYYLKVNI